MVLWAKGWRPGQIAEAVGSSRSTVYNVRRRWMELGEAGLVDRREDNGPVKVDPTFLKTLRWVLEHTPEDFGWSRPTWTRELLILTLEGEDLPAVSPPTMSRALRKLGVRRGRPRPVVRCPWPEEERLRRMEEIFGLLENLPSDEVAFWEDEVDIHLNPKIGLDYMLPAQQREVVTPGQNRKCYMAGARQSKTRRLIWVTGLRKNSRLFIGLIAKIAGIYRRARKIHFIVDNFKIHDSKQTQKFVEALEGRVEIHFLPPYDPDDQPMDRVWQDLHAEVTRNHRHREMPALVEACHQYLRRRDQFRHHMPLSRVPA